MLLNLLTATEDPMRAPENLGEPALYALLGFLVVFVGITFLIFVVWLLGKILHRPKVEKPVKRKEKTSEPAVSETLAVTQANGTEEVSEETVAVIMAALMAYYQQVDGPKCEFRVRRIKRI